MPGVGHFAATRALDEGWRAEIGAAVRADVPLLGICLGLQYLLEGNDEAPEAPGLGLLDGCSACDPALKGAARWLERTRDLTSLPDSRHD